MALEGSLDGPLGNGESLGRFVVEINAGSYPSKEEAGHAEKGIWKAEVF
jgi:hypothetical protein